MTAESLSVYDLLCVAAWQVGAGHHLHFQTRTRVKQERKDNQAADTKMRQQGVAALRKTLRQVCAMPRPSHAPLFCFARSACRRSLFVIACS